MSIIWAETVLPAIKSSKAWGRGLVHGESRLKAERTQCTACWNPWRALQRVQGEFAEKTLGKLFEGNKRNTISVIERCKEY